jgi:uncharacterized LabA/DUF88 family protein
MEINKVAILVDGSFFRKKFQETNNKKSPKVADLELLISDTISKIQKITGSDSVDSLFRVFYYDCKSYSNSEKDPTGKIHNFKDTSSYKASESFQNDLKKTNRMAIRLGSLSFDGWKINQDGSYKPDFKQKSVDMKIGLDIAWMSSKKIVDKIVLIAGDSDFISPMKFARREGILVYLQTMGHNVKLELIEHSDYLLK